MSRAQRLLVPVLLPAAFLFATDSGYREPPDAVRDALRALPTPIVSVSPQRGYAVFMQPVRYPPIAEVAQPMLRLAGNQLPGVVLSAFEHRLDRTARTYLSFIGAPESDRLP